MALLKRGPNRAKIWAPEGYWNLSPKAKKKLCNGCGPKGLGGFIVPNTLWGLSILEACNIHDFMYHEGHTINEKTQADRTFLNNMIRIIDEDSGAFLRPLRRYRAMSYYSAVKDFGGPKFWENVNSPFEVRPCE